jgi:hypothetical protein
LNLSVNRRPMRQVLPTPELPTKMICSARGGGAWHKPQMCMWRWAAAAAAQRRRHPPSISDHFGAITHLDQMVLRASGAKVRHLRARAAPRARRPPWGSDGNQMGPELIW